MRKKIITLLFFIITLLVVFPLAQVKGANLETVNTANKYKIIIEDDADLLTANEEKELSSVMEELTEFGNVMFKTTNSVSNYSSLKYIQNYYYSMLGNQSGVAFYIDMNARQVCACATGGLDKTITSAKCDTIMDNIYRYATNKKYFECAVETFSQMNRLLNGQRIAESMKYICNGILSIMISLFVSYGFFMAISGNKKATQKDLINECVVNLEHTPINVTKTGSHSVYSPVSDSSSSGGSSGGSRGRRIFWQWRKPRLLRQHFGLQWFKNVDLRYINGKKDK